MPAASGPPVLGIDLGGTKILTGVVDHANRILGRAKRATPSQVGGEAIVETIADAATEALTAAGIAGRDIAGVTVGSPGPLDPSRGVILFSANLAVKDFPLGPELSRRLGKPVMVWNDVRVGGYGEYHLGAGRDCSSMLAAFVGTGIGGCVIIHDQIVVGATGNAGEIGHIPIRKKGLPCGCGRRGCMEMYASRTAIARRIRKAVRKGAGSEVSAALVGKTGDRIKSRELAAAYATGDPLVVREVHRAATNLGRGLGGLVNVIEPEVVILGGGLAEALGQPYLDLVSAAAHAQMLTTRFDLVRFALAELGDDAGILGAALLARERFAPPGTAGVHGAAV